MCIYYVYTLIYKLFSGPNCFILFFFPLPYDEFVWRASSSWIKALMHIPFYVKWVVLFPEESCTVKTSLVVTHSVFLFLNHCYTSWILQFVGLFNEVWLRPSYALPKWNLAYYLAFCWSQYGQGNNKTKMAGQTSCVL